MNYDSQTSNFIKIKTTKFFIRIIINKLLQRQAIKQQNLSTLSFSTSKKIMVSKQSDQKFNLSHELQISASDSEPNLFIKHLLRSPLNDSHLRQTAQSQAKNQQTQKIDNVPLLNTNKDANKQVVQNVTNQKKTQKKRGRGPNKNHLTEEEAKSYFSFLKKYQHKLQLTYKVSNHTFKKMQQEIFFQTQTTPDLDDLKDFHKNQIRTKESIHEIIKEGQKVTSEDQNKPRNNVALPKKGKKSSPFVNINLRKDHIRTLVLRKFFSELLGQSISNSVQTKEKKINAKQSLSSMEIKVQFNVPLKLKQSSAKESE